VSSIGFHNATIRDRSAGSGVAAAVILLLFLVAALFSAQRKDVTQGFDEVAHLSYVAQLQKSGEFWPRLESLRMLDPASFRFTAAPNYLNHPPFYYWLLARLGPNIEDNPGAALAHRIVNILLATLGLAALLALGHYARFDKLEFYAYAVPLFCIPVLAPIAGAVNSDNAAFAGGALATLAAWQLIAGRSRQWLAAMLAGVVIASWAKFTGFVLSGGLAGGVLLYLLWRRRLSAIWVLPAMLALMVALAPYALFLAQYGSPTPETPGLAAMLRDGARAAGWADAPRLAFPAYVVHFVSEFITGWMPTLATRSAMHYAALALPVAAVLCAVAGLALSLRRLQRREETTLDIMVVAGMAAIAVTLACHIVFSYRHHLATGWMMEAYPRYYLPLAAIIPLAGLSLLAAVHHPRWRNALLALLIAGPILFRLFGAPLGS
jgi:hypothetical protein